jgi:hypothetical protein
MSKWNDGVTLADVPLQGVLLAAGELAVRVAEERRRLMTCTACGVKQVGGVLCILIHRVE